jgi:hypothetical protein
LLFVFLVTGVCLFAASVFSTWPPKLHSRFLGYEYQPLDRPTLDIAPGEEQPEDEEANTNSPERQRGHLLPTLVLLVTLRTEMYHHINRNQQCARPGVESFLCVLLFGYELYLSQRKWAAPPPEDLDDPWRSTFDDVRDWLIRARADKAMAYLGTFIFSLGTYLALTRTRDSGYFCVGLVDSRTGILSLQWASLLVDTAIVVLFWQAMAWTISTQIRLRTASIISLQSCLCIGVFWIAGLAIGSSDAAFGSLHPLNTILDGTAMAILFGTASAWFCEETPLVPASKMTILLGIWVSMDKMGRFGNWMPASQSDVLLPPWIIFLGTSLFIYGQDIRSFLFIRRPGFIILFLIFLSVSTIKMSTQSPRILMERHPIDKLISEGQMRHDHWSKEAKISESFPVAVQTYQKIYGGRLPPPHFSDWYQFAEGSLIIDRFGQIEKDLEPFRAMTPQDLRDRVARAADYAGVVTITIKAGGVSLTDAGTVEGNQDLQEVAQMIQKFSKHLPDMIVPINLGPAPRILPKWEDALSRQLFKRGEKDNQGFGTLTKDYGQMQAQACPPTSRARTHPQWNFAELCVECGQTRSRGPLMAEWDELLDVCAQPDLIHLHGFSMLQPQHEPIDELLPLFGASKTGSFWDILMPIPKSRLEKSDKKWSFERRHDSLFWTGTVGNQTISSHLLRGGHKYRLLHLLNTPGPREEAFIVLPDRESGGKFGYEKISARKASAVLPFTAGLVDLGGCLGDKCRLLEQAYGNWEDATDPMEYRYVLVLDNDDGAAPEMLRTLSSNSVPLISTIFQTWFTDRLTPWVHFVPVDVRYQSLHTVFTYFSGTVDRPMVSDNPKPIEEHTRKAERIVEQGRKWAEAAISQKDMEIYLFRLLLEWGRLINDRRDEIGFRIGEGGEHVNDGWSVKG